MAGSFSRVNRFLQETPFLGALDDADVIGGANVDGRPPEAIIFLKVDQGRIAAAGFQSSGCGYLRACCSALLEQVMGRVAADSANFNETQLVDYLGHLPESKQYCAALAVMAFRNALAKLSAQSSAQEESL